MIGSGRSRSPPRRVTPPTAPPAAASSANRTASPAGHGLQRDPPATAGSPLDTPCRRFRVASSTGSAAARAATGAICCPATCRRSGDGPRRRFVARAERAADGDAALLSVVTTGDAGPTASLGAERRLTPPRPSCLRVEPAPRGRIERTGSRPRTAAGPGRSGRAADCGRAAFAGGTCRGCSGGAAGGTVTASAGGAAGSDGAGAAGGGWGAGGAGGAGAAAGSGAGVGGGGGAGGGGVGAARGGSSERGSTYVSPSPTRTPRCTYGRSCSGVPDAPACAIGCPSSTRSPRRTSSEPRWIREALWPSVVEMVIVSPCVGTVPANVTSPAAGERTGDEASAAMSSPRCWPAAYRSSATEYSRRTGPSAGHDQAWATGVAVSAPATTMTAASRRVVRRANTRRP
jgi:hypothetical protein